MDSYNGPDVSLTLCESLSVGVHVSVSLIPALTRLQDYSRVAHVFYVAQGPLGPASYMR